MALHFPFLPVRDPLEHAPCVPSGQRHMPFAPLGHQRISATKSPTLWSVRPTVLGWPNSLPSLDLLLQLERVPERPSLHRNRVSLTSPFSATTLSINSAAPPRLFHASICDASGRSDHRLAIRGSPHGRHLGNAPPLPRSPYRNWREGSGSQTSIASVHLLIASAVYPQNASSGVGA